MSKSFIAEAVPAKDETIKAAIIDAAQKLFKHYGLNKTTMEDIARSLGKSKSSLYYYYATKEDIFEAVIEKEKGAIFEEINSAIDQASSAADKFRIFAYTKFNEIGKRHILYKVVFDEVYDNVCLFKMIRKKYDNIEFEIIKKILSYGVDTGEFKLPGADADTIPLVCAITLRGIHLNYMFDEVQDYDASIALVKAAVVMLLNALKN